MRTTVTLDPDVDARLRSLARSRGVALRVVINDTLRAGMTGHRDAGVPYRLPSRSLGVRPGVDLDKALALAAELEDEEIGRKLDVRK